MIEWIKTKELSIFFDETPHVKMRYLLPSTPKDEIISIQLYPFICTKTLKVIVFDKRQNNKWKRYHFTIPKGYCYDGCTIPRLLWTLTGMSKESNKGLVASLIHDVLCENHKYINHDRRLSSLILRELFIQGGISTINAHIMAEFVDIFQRFCKWGNKV